MRAALFHEFGGPEVVCVEDVPVPVPGAGEVRIAVRAAALNHLDLWVRRGLPTGIVLPHIGGSDLAGIVDAVGPGMDPALEGARVAVDPSLDYEWYEGTPQGPSFEMRRLRLIGEHVAGGFAEFTVVPTANLLEIPDAVPFETAAAAGLVFVTAWHALMVRGGLRAGESVLVTGASGGVSTAAIQVAKLAGAEVHALTSGRDHAERVRALGADHVYDRSDGDWVEALAEATGGRGVDLAIDSVGEALWEGVLRSLGVGGRLVAYGATTGPRVGSDVRHIFWNQLSILGSTMGTPAEFRSVMRLVFEGRLKPVVDRVVGLEDARSAHELLEQGAVFGKIVLTP
jgi:NADPH:quinone reductase-like Zn-dependent oxidoreductase